MWQRTVSVGTGIFVIVITKAPEKPFCPAWERNLPWGVLPVTVPLTG